MKGLERMDNQTLKNKIRGSLIGGAIGDALGHQIEFDDCVKDKQVTKFRDDFGIISDDTQMTLFTANALLWRHTQWRVKGAAPQPAEAVYRGYLDWYKTQMSRGNNNLVSVVKDIYLRTGKGSNSDQICWLVNNQEVHKRQAPGNTCLTALRSGKMGTINQAINNSKGCGGVMRIAPCGLVNPIPDAAGYLAAQCSAITHGHPLSHMASYMCAALISILTYTETDMEQAVRDALSFSKERQDDLHVSDDEMKAFVNMIEKAVTLSQSHPDSDAKAIKSIGGGWTAEDALAIAIYACLRYDSFEDIIICAANHDGDSDSTAAIAGNIVGAYLGIDKIPEYFISHVELKDTVLEIADDLWVAFTNPSCTEDNDWQKKYL